MTREEIGRLFVSMRKEVNYATGRWLKGDREAREEASCNTLLTVLDMTFATPDAARAGILTAAERAGFLLFQQQRERKAERKPALVGANGGGVKE